MHRHAYPIEVVSSGTDESKAFPPRLKFSSLGSHEVGDHRLAARARTTGAFAVHELIQRSIRPVCQVRETMIRDDECERVLRCDAPHIRAKSIFRAVVVDVSGQGWQLHAAFAPANAAVAVAATAVSGPGAIAPRG